MSGWIQMPHERVMQEAFKGPLERLAEQNPNMGIKPLVIEKPIELNVYKKPDDVIIYGGYEKQERCGSR